MKFSAKFLAIPLILAASLICLHAYAVPPTLTPPMPAEEKTPLPSKVNVTDREVDLNSASTGKTMAIELLTEATGYAKQGQFELASKSLIQAIECLNESDVNLASALHTNLGSCYDRMGKLNEALAEFEKAGKLNPTESEVLYNQALVFAKLGRYADAEKNLESYISKQRDPQLRAEAQVELSKVREHLK